MQISNECIRKSLDNVAFALVSQKPISRRFNE